MAQFRNRPRTSRIRFSVYVGLFAGILWGAVKLAEHSLKFTKIVPGFLVEPFYRHSYLGTWQGYMIGWLSFVLFSVAAAILYTWVLGKARGPGAGIGYGVAWWCLLYLLIGPLLGMVPPITHLDMNSFVTDLCLFLVWGLFIGYSISFEFTDVQKREPVKSS